MSKKDQRDEFTEQEAQRRFEATLSGAINTPPKPHKETSAKAGSPRGSRSTKPNDRLKAH
jgi:hypothetical protein